MRLSRPLFLFIARPFFPAGIIFEMPTPFYHVSLAGALLNQPNLPEAIAQFLQDSPCEFVFGNTAPDVQVVSGQLREATHFFSLPIQAGDQPAWEAMLSTHPSLARAGRLDRSRAAFLAGYLCHLQADWIWVKEIFAPIFGPGCSWGTFSQRLYYHNVLRAYLDLHILAELPTGMDSCLGEVHPESWLPFVQDRHLVDWRDFISTQLRSGGAIQTVEVFSSRQGISAPEYYALIESDERMQQEIFNHISLEVVKDYKQRVLEENICLLENYLAFTLHPSPIPVEGYGFRGAQQ
jgi:hypothetical protein